MDVNYKFCDWRVNVGGLSSFCFTFFSSYLRLPSPFLSLCPFSPLHHICLHWLTLLPSQRLGSVISSWHSRTTHFFLYLMLRAKCPYFLGAIKHHFSNHPEYLLASLSSTEPTEEAVPPLICLYSSLLFYSHALGSEIHLCLPTPI